jgi:molybdopterin converting factor small subunit
MLIAVNGERILHLRHFGTALRDGDVVAFLPICGGG